MGTSAHASSKRKPPQTTEAGRAVMAPVDLVPRLTADEAAVALRVERDARSLGRDLERAIAAAAAAGELVDHEVVVQEIRARYAGKVPPSVLRELDGV